VHVTVCIVAFHNVTDVQRCVAAVGQSTHQLLDIVICENGGPAAEAELRASLPVSLPSGGKIIVIGSGQNLGYAGAFNLCVAAAPSADAWWLVNPDAEPEPEALHRMLTILNSGEADAVGGSLCLADGRVQGHGGHFRTWLARAESIGHGTSVESLPERAAVEAKMNYILGASILVGRHFLDVAGPMRDDYFLYAEEVEWGLRAKSRGLRLGFAPGARIWHRQGSTTGSARSIALRPWLPVYLDERNRLNVVRDTNRLLLPIAVLTTVPLILLRYTRRGAWAQTGYAFAGWWAGVCNRRGMPAGLE
jgi:N-acetylglucosaminyl-diphospho-decaprenol L-rhamnosyltransferase